MCDPTYPVFRFGYVLRAEPSMSPADAVEVATRLYDERARLVDGLVSRLQALGGVSDVQPDQRPNAVRVRSVPALTIDFPPIDFAWLGHQMEFRPCITACSSVRKAKIWVRYNLRKTQTRMATVASFYDWVQTVNEPLQDFCLAFYNEQLKALGFESRMSRTYTIAIKMVSARNDEIKAELAREFSQLDPDEERAGEAYRLLMKELEGDCGVKPRRKELGDHTKLVGFRYLRKQDPNDDKIDILLKGPQTDSPGLVPPQGDDTFEALCIVDYDNDGLEIAGVAHETNPPMDFRRSAPHIVSGEISLEVANAY